MQEKEYVQVLLHSLEKKIEVLKKIVAYNEEQNELLQKENVDIDEWQAIVDKKATQIDEINFLDEGFENVYERVKQALELHRKDYEPQIKELQRLITVVTELSVNIQAQENRNKQLAQMVFSEYKKKSRRFQENKKALNVYRNQMRKTSVIDAQFLDKEN